MSSRVVCGLVFLFANILWITGCGNMTSYLERKNWVSENDTPDPSKAYFYGRFFDKTLKGRLVRIDENSILFKNSTTNKTLDFGFQKKNQFILFPVEPGNYKNNFGKFTWDAIFFRWVKCGEYKISENVKKEFEVVAGKVYYIGDFTHDRFYYDFKEDVNNFYTRFPKFKILSLNEGYNQRCPILTR